MRKIINAQFLCALALYLMNSCVLASQIERKVIEQKNGRYRYGIDVEYPYLGNNPRFNQAVNHYIDKSINRFIKRSKSALSLPKDVLGENSLVIEYTVVSKSKKVLSVLMNKMNYLRGMAHPNTSHASFTVIDGQLVSLSSLLKKQGLEDLSKFCTNFLLTKKISDEKWVQEGAGPRLANYRTWTLNSEGLVIIFDAYRVAPYVYGTQKITVPAKVAKHMLLPNQSIQALWKL